MAFPPQHRNRRLLIRFAVLILVAWLVAALGRQALGQPSPSVTHATAARVDLTISGKRLTAELADTPERRARGLMYRTELAPDHGMLFIFEQVERHCMWMRNTPLPLSVAFVDASGRIINIADMAPLTETSHCAAKPALYALETRQGWFSRHRLGPGDKIEGIPRP
jgi:uncharacterized protein